MTDCVRLLLGLQRREMAEGMDIDPAPAVRDKKRFEVKKVGCFLKFMALEGKCMKI